MSAGESKQRIIASIIQDFDLQPRLNNDRGHGDSGSGHASTTPATIFAASRTRLRKYCGIVTSYEPNHNAISREPANSDERYKFDTYTKQS